MIRYFLHVKLHSIGAGVEVGPKFTKFRNINAQQGRIHITRAQQLRYPNRKRKPKKGHGKSKVNEGHGKAKRQNLMKMVAPSVQEYEDNYFLPVIFRNLTSHDAHFVLKHFKKL